MIKYEKSDINDLNEIIRCRLEFIREDIGPQTQEDEATISAQLEELRKKIVEFLKKNDKINRRNLFLGDFMKKNFFGYRIFCLICWLCFCTGKKLCNRFGRHN